eukprot:2533705-Karenia_brevis.AAC.1
MQAFFETVGVYELNEQWLHEIDQLDFDINSNDVNVVTDVPMKLDIFDKPAYAYLGKASSIKNMVETWE